MANGNVMSGILHGVYFEGDVVLFYWAYKDHHDAI